MRYYKKCGAFKSPQCLFDLNKMEAWSYGWWRFVESKQGIVYFNSASYSMQTSKQQDIVSSLLKQLGIKFRVIYVSKGLQNIPGEIKRLEYEIETCLSGIANPRSQKRANQNRRARIESLKNQIERLKAYKKLKASRFVLPYSARTALSEIIEKQKAKTSAVRIPHEYKPKPPSVHIVRMNECRDSVGKHLINPSQGEIDAAIEDACAHLIETMCIKGRNLRPSTEKKFYPAIPEPN